MAKAKDLATILLVTLVSTLFMWWKVGLPVIKQNFDGPYYAVVAKSFYDPLIIRANFSFPLPVEYYPAHFPVFPFLMRIVDELTGIGYLGAGLVVNLLASVLTAVTIYLVSSKLKLASPLILSLVWLFWWPRMWAVRSIAGPETLFILFIVSSLYFFDIRKYWLAGLTGAAAVLTKSPGILLFPAFIVASKFDRKIWPTLLIPCSLLLLFTFYYLRTGDFWAYFHSGDNIHLQILPFKVFDSSQPWVGNFWLEDILWIYLIGGIGVWQAYKKNKIWGWFGIVFYSTILFVSHRDISRYSLPLVPVILLGLENVLAKKEVKWVLALMVIPLFFYTANFLSHNTAAIANWAPFFSK